MGGYGWLFRGLLNGAIDEAQQPKIGTVHHHMLTREEECNRILDVHSNFDEISAALDRQFRTIHNRAQLLLTICGILISANVLVTTGRIISAPLHPQHLAGLLASILLAAAGLLEVTSAAVVVGWVLNVRWITQQPGADRRGWILSNLAYRDSKTRAYRVGTLLVLLAMLCYQVAISLALVHM